MVGSSIKRKLKKLGYTNLLVADKKKINLLDQKKVFNYLKKNKPSLVISLQANSPDIRATDINRGVEKLIKNNLNEVISTDLDGIQNAALRVMKFETVFQKSLSTYCGFIITDTTDIHTLNDLKLLERNKIHENK